MMRGLIAILMFVFAAHGAAANGNGDWDLGVDELSQQAQAHLACMESYPSREGPEPCGVGPYVDGCDDTGCLWRHLQGWIELSERFADRAPKDWPERLAGIDAVPTYFHLGTEDMTRDGPKRLTKDCVNAGVGVDRLSECIFHAANFASAWLDIYNWLDGQDPRQRATND